MPWVEAADRDSESWADTSKQLHDAGSFACPSWRLQLLEKALDAVNDSVTISIVVHRGSGEASQAASAAGGSGSLKPQSTVLYQNRAALATARRCGGSSSTAGRSESVTSQFEAACAATISDAHHDGSASSDDVNSELLTTELLLDARSLSLLEPREDGPGPSQAAGPSSGESASATAGRSAEVGTRTRDPAVLISSSTSVSPLCNPGLRAVLDSAPQGVFLCHPNAQVEWMSSAVEATAGLHPRRMVGRGWVHAVHPDDLPLALAVAEQMRTTGECSPLELRMAGSGLTRTADHDATAAATAAADEIAVVSTDRRDAGSTTTAASRTAEHSDDAGPDHHDAFSDGTSRHGAAATAEVDAASCWRYYDLAIKALRHPATGAIMRWIGIITDVHERRMLKQKLEEEKALFMTVMDQLPLALFVADAPSGKFRVINRNADVIWRKPMAVELFDDYAPLEGYHLDGQRFAMEDWPLYRSLFKGETVTNEDLITVRG